MAYTDETGGAGLRGGSACGPGWGWGGCGHGAARAADIRPPLQPLLEHLALYDARRRTLEVEGGDLADVRAVTELLTRRVALRGRYGERQAALADPAGLRAALADLGHGDLHADIRQRPSGMPVYYLCRVCRDYWSEYSLVVEDLYRSAGYPMLDERFVRLMAGGHETYYLRLSQFRGAAGGESDEADDLLYHAGRHVFQAAWHEDQRPGVLIAGAFGLRSLREAVEVLYLCLSGELCALRGATDARLLAFFESAYPQPAIRSFLVRLGGLDGAAINGLPRCALGLYARLSAALGRFLAIEVPWGHRRTRVPLYKLVFANLARLGAVAAALAGEPPVGAAARRLEEEAAAIARQAAGE